MKKANFSTVFEKRRRRRSEIRKRKSNYTYCKNNGKKAEEAKKYGKGEKFKKIKIKSLEEKN